ncbi:N,N-dimethylformamidase beta subunit family domain-containing protein [Streptomyces cavernicola]|uniref:Tachylectin-related carbohydrate-binding protein n=1 Tax=Streptomyces cavernicola TaxID=3043613 RepID=A0ABT6S7C1_9ACTN|nr:N,N-dimethylformamidase beta subunit family domain-containing protein [Streptomyces sp. B-S-A6]MDI3403979.1 tachylectin-related carbohydrate-binding protein [Streptomyces sp. B-S-A6]
MAYDWQQRFLNLVPGGNGIIYAIQADGNLYWYRHIGWSSGTTSWANSGQGRLIGTSWQKFRFVLAAADGQIFACLPNGDLLWYRYILSNSTTGAGSWHSASGRRIGTQWNFPRVIGGWNNVLYAEDGNGDLRWYKYTGTNGSFSWAANSGSKIGTQWHTYTQLFADPNGVIFGTRHGSALGWFRYLGNGEFNWANGGKPVDTMILGPFERGLFSNGSGAIYKIQTSSANPPGPDNRLQWYRLLNSETVNTSGVTWADGSGKVVGSGFSREESAALQGYAASLSTSQSSTLGIHVSTTFSSYTSSTLRLAPTASAPAVVTPPTTRAGKFQLLQSGYHAAGCGWAQSFSISVGTGTSWPSGIYASQLKSPDGKEHNVMFVVRPSTPLRDIAVLVPTNTYSAYNFWGGHNQYTTGSGQRTISMQRPNMGTSWDNTYSTAPGIIDHLLYSDLQLLRWMTSQSIAYDCYADTDLHATGATWLKTPAQGGNYKALVLTTHPEYFSQTARDNVVAFQNNGGRIIYLGGNGIYERVQFTADGRANIFRRPDGARDPFADSGQSEAQILGVSHYGPTYMSFSPYEVQDTANNPFTAGTGLSVGDTFGAVAYDIAASGWEVDRRPAPLPGSVLIAEGLNQSGGAEMLYVPAAAGKGWVFSVSSLTFTGSVPIDSAVQKILTNVFTEAVA